MTNDIITYSWSHIIDNLMIDVSGTYMYDLSHTSRNLHIVIKNDSQVNLFFLVHDGENRVSIKLVDASAVLSCSAIVLSSNSIGSNLTISASLEASDTKADIYMLSLLGDNARASVNGEVVINPSIQRAEGYLSEENLLLGKNIKIKTLPMLDVRSNDVKASHGAKIDRLDPQKLFYLSAKWLPKSQAEDLMIHAYIQKALDHTKISDDNIIKNIKSKM